MTTAQLAYLVTGHMTTHGLPEPASLDLIVSTVDEQEVRVHLRTYRLMDTAAGLLAWANTQAAVTLEAWRPMGGSSVHLDLRSTLTGEHGTAILVVFGAVRFEPAVFPDLEPREHRPVSQGQLTAWATGAEVAA